MTEFERLVKLIGTSYSPEQWQAAFDWIYISLKDACTRQAHCSHIMDPDYQVEVWMDYRGTGSWRLYKVSIEKVDC